MPDTPFELRAEDLRVGLGEGAARVEVLQAASLRVASGELVAIRGASGSGKSTLLHVLGGMLRPDAGTVRLAGKDPWALGAGERAAWRNSQVGFVFQAHHLLSELTALENVMAPAWLARAPSAPAEQAARSLLERLGLASRLHHHPAELSGGEAQRVALARALIRRPPLVLADEPTGNLDEEAGRLVFEELKDLQRERRFILLVATHDERLAARCDRVAHLSGGRLAGEHVAGSPPHVI